MPNPSKGETQQDFVSRCIPIVLDDGTAKDSKQAAAVCYSIWRRAKGEKDEPPKKEGSDNMIVRKLHADTVIGRDFVLSDATVDRYGDMIDASGWELTNFQKNPIALFNHNPHFPVGKWSNLRVEGNVLRGRLELAPEGTSDRIDEIRRLVDAGILRAVSVGFKEIESKPRVVDKAISGKIFMKSELVETSLVSVPANPNALAIAKSLRVSDDTIDLVFAEQGKPTGSLVRRGVDHGENAENPSRHQRTQAMQPTISDRVADAEKRVVSALDALSGHESKIDDTNVSDSDITIRKELVKKLDQETEARDSLKDVEKRMIALTTATSGNGADANRGGSSTLAVRNDRPFAIPTKKLRPADYVWRALSVGAKHFCEGRERHVLDVLQGMYGQDEATRHVIANLVTRAAVIPADTTTATWATELVSTAIADFRESLMPVSVYPQLASRGVSYTFGRNGIISIPSRDATPTVGGAFVLQAGAIPVKQASFSAVTLTPKKAGVICVFTRELAEHSTPDIEATIRRTIMEDTAVSIDAILLDAGAATATRPAGLRNGVAALGPTAGGAVMAAVVGDISLMIGALYAATNGNVRSPVWIMNPGDALKIAMMPTAAGNDMPFRSEVNGAAAGGTLMGIPILKTASCTADTMYLIDAADFGTASDAAPRFDISDQAVLHMEDTTPLAIGTAGSPATVAAPTRSLYQTDTFGIRMIWMLNWAMLRTGSVQYVTNLSWN